MNEFIILHKHFDGCEFAIRISSINAISKEQDCKASKVYLVEGENIEWVKVSESVE